MKIVEERVLNWWVSCLCACFIPRSYETVFHVVLATKNRHKDKDADLGCYWPGMMQVSLKTHGGVHIIRLFKGVFISFSCIV